MPHQPAAHDGAVRVLIVDDEPELRELLSVAVAAAGWHPFLAPDGHSAVQLSRACRPHVVVLDWMLPDLNGLRVLRRLRHDHAGLPILMLTARDALDHRLDGLSAGADDYVTKPFSLEEVMLRLRGLLRRCGLGTEESSEDGSVRALGDLVLSEQGRKAHRGGVSLRLTAKEFDLLWFLMGHPRQVFSKAHLLDHVWNSSFDGEGNLVEVYVHSLRSKIDKGRTPMIHTVRGAGYVLRAAHEGP
ncbi:response regulator transcription factor [Streptomyces sp. NBC_01275]|uniref:response regulator transcription factor n=1 Tax=Streptomyces sp. NBC_01275 TaxID=2903807 RepID=UPI002252D92F|nr:response regulator transcription factor [Streptomyces sp. NBC_01275]MCX4767897.1 response regulator transcription factor [Streptomyces sp. NBC_01275]